MGQDAKADNLRRILSEHQSEELATGLTDALLYPGVSGLELVTWHEVFERGEQVQLKCDVTFDAGGQTILWRHDLYEGELPSDFVVLSLDPCEHTYLIAKMSIAGEPILSAKTATYVRRECIKHSFDTSRQAWNQVEWDLEQRDLMPTQFRWAQWPGLHCSQWRGDTYDLAEKKGVTLPARLARTTVAPLPGSNKYVQRKKHIEYEKTVNALTLLRICVIRLNQYECGDPRRIKAFNQTLICYYQCVLKVLKFDELLQPQSWWPPAMGVDYEVTCSKKFSYQEIQSFIGTPYSEATHNPDWRCKKLLEHLSQFMPQVHICYYLHEIAEIIEDPIEEDEVSPAADMFVFCDPGGARILPGLPTSGGGSSGAGPSGTGLSIPSPAPSPPMQEEAAGPLFQAEAPAESLIFCGRRLFTLLARFSSPLASLACVPRQNDYGHSCSQDKGTPAVDGGLSCLQLVCARSLSAARLHPTRSSSRSLACRRWERRAARVRCCRFRRRPSVRRPPSPLPACARSLDASGVPCGT